MVALRPIGIKDSWGFMEIRGKDQDIMNPHESEGGFMGENKSPLIPMTHESAMT